MLTGEVEEKRMEGRMSKDGVDRGGGGGENGRQNEHRRC